MEPEWAPLIARALAWRADGTADKDALTETLRFTCYAVARNG